MPLYRSEREVHVVFRRFSDFEYLIKELEATPEYKSICFSKLPEKRVIGNLDDSFIEKRRVELEGFLRVLVQS